MAQFNQPTKIFIADIGEDKYAFCSLKCYADYVRELPRPDKPDPMPTFRCSFCYADLTEGLLLC